MAKIDVQDASITINADWRERDLVRQLPGARYDRAADLWRMPLAWASCVVLRGVFGDGLEISDELAQWSWDTWTRQIAPALDLRQAADAPDVVQHLFNSGFTLLAESLYPFQRAATQFMISRERVLNASQPGLGKTVETIATLALSGALPALVVCTNSMKRTWELEFKRWAPALSVAVVGGSAAQRRKAILGGADVVVINWEALRSHSRLAGYGSVRLERCEECGGPAPLPEAKRQRCDVHSRELNEVAWRTVVADEAHRGKSAIAQQTRALWAAAATARYRIALTGTPIANRVDDLWAIMHFVAPEEWPSKTKFIDRYGLVSWNAFGGMEIVGLRPEHRDEFFKILDPRMRRDLTATCLPQLPPLTRTRRYVEMSAKQAKAYKQMRKEMLAELDNDYVAFVTNPLARMTRLEQFAAAYAEVQPDGSLRLADPSSKVDALVDVLDELGDTPCVVFAESRQLVQLCEKRLEKLKISYVAFHGQVSTAERDRNLAAFQRGDARVFLATIAAGGESITLTTAPVAIFLQRPRSNVLNLQAEGRVYRASQTSDRVEIIDIVTTGTVEEGRFALLRGKDERLEEVVRDRLQLRALIAYGEDS